MNEFAEKEKAYTSYEYKELAVSGNKASLYLDCYESFGWKIDDRFAEPQTGGKVVLKLKRDRKIANKMELTRLQRNFEACIEEITVYEKGKTNRPKMWALTIGIIGTAFMAGSVFAVTATPPMIVLCILLAIPAFLGWVSPLFIYRKMLEKEAQKTNPLIEEKYEEIYSICQKGQSLL